MAIYSEIFLGFLLFWLLNIGRKMLVIRVLPLKIHVHLSHLESC